jgi:hypothetical protein
VPLMPAASTESTVVPRSAFVLAGGGAMVVVALPSGVALIATESRCNSNPDGDTSNPEWTFSGYCKALSFHPYVDSVNFAGGLLPGIFGLPVIAVLIATSLAISFRRLTPIKRGLYLGVALVVCLFVVDVGFADATFHGAG